MKASLVIFSIICVDLLAGCAARDASPKASASSSVPVVVSANSTTNVMDKRESSKRLESLDEARRLQNGTPFAKYDSVVVDAINQRWNDIVDKAGRAVGTGKVVVQFHFQSAGTVSDLKIMENSAGEMAGNLSKKAIADCAPFTPWPPDMAGEVGPTGRIITFTFYYR